MSEQPTGTATLTITDAWTWRGPWGEGWRALGSLTSASGAGDVPVLIVHSSTSGQTMAYRRHHPGSIPDWGAVLASASGSVSPRELFPTTNVNVLSKVEELWNVG